MYKRFLTILVMAGVCSLALPATAKKTKRLTAEEIKTQECVSIAEEAKGYFNAKQHKEAVRLFMRAYAKCDRPAALFNAARAAEEGEDYKKAVGLFNVYAKRKDADPKGKDDAISRSKALSEVLEEQKKKAKPSVVVSAPAGPMASSPPATTPKDSQIDKTLGQKGPTKSMGEIVRDTYYLDPWTKYGWRAGLGLGVLTAGLGTWMTIDGANKGNDAKNVSFADGKDLYKSTVNDAESRRNWGLALTGVGLATALASGYKIWIAPGISDKHVAVAMRF